MQTQVCVPQVSATGRLNHYTTTHLLKAVGQTLAGEGEALVQVLATLAVVLGLLVEGAEVE